MVEIKNKSIKAFLEVKFNKNLSDITEEEITQVKSIAIEGEKKSDNTCRIDFSEIKIFNNLEEVNIKNTLVSSENLNILSSLSNLKSIYFEKSIFEDESNIAVLNECKCLELINCYNEKYDFLKEFNKLESLVIINPYTEDVINLEVIQNNKDIKKLELENCNIENFSIIQYLPNLEYLSLLGTPLPENYCEIIETLHKLNKLFISKEYSSAKLNKNNLSIASDFSEYAFFDDIEVANNQKK